MRNKFFFALTLVSLVVFAQLADSVKWELSYRNSVVNGGFEQGKQGFSSTGNSTFRQITNTSLVGSGKASGYIDFTAASEKLRSDLFTIPNALKGRTCLAKFIYNGGGGADIRYWIENQSGTVVAGYGFSGSTNEVITSAATNYTDSRDINFTCPTSGSLRIVLEGQGNANALYVDDFYIGRPFTYIATDALGGSGNDFTYGDGLATNKRLTWNRGSNNPQIRWNESTSRLEYSNNGSNFAAIGSGGQFANYTNILENPSFEDGIANYSVTGSASLTQSSTNPAFGTYKAIVDFSAAGEFFRNTTQTIPQGLYGENCLVRFRYQGGGTSDIYYRVTDGTNTLAGYTSTSTQFKITTAASTWTDSLDLTFPCPSSGGLRLELESAGNAAALSVDDIYIGENFKLGSVSQAELAGTLSYAGTTSCAWSTSSTSVASFAADTDCPTPSVTGIVSAAGTKIPGFSIASVKPGLYKVTANIRTQTNTAGGDCHLSLYDGTTTAGQAAVYSSTGGASGGTTLVGYFPYSTAQSSLTFQIRAKVSTGSCFLYNSDSSDRAEFIVERFPLTSEVAVSANVPYQGGKATMTGATNCSWVSSSATYANFANDADCNNFTFTGNLSACTNAKTPCVKANSLEAGSYLVLSVGTHIVSDSSTGLYQIYDGTTAGGSFSLSNQTSSTDGRTSVLAAVFNYTSKQSNIEFNVRAIRTAGTSIFLENTTTNHQYEMHVIPLSPSVAMPNLVGSVTSNTTGSERIERLSFGGASNPSSCTSNPCTIYSQTGSWVSGVAYTGTGRYTVTVNSGIFASAPTCIVSTIQDQGQIDVYASSATTITIRGNSFAGAARDTAVYLICQGPRP